MKNKNISLVFVILGICMRAIGQAESGVQAATNTPPSAAKIEAANRKLIEEYDVNRNGKIDIQERKPYLRKLSKIRQEESHRQVQSALHTPRVEGLPAAWDTNQDGRIDANERRQALASRTATSKVRVSNLEELAKESSINTNQPPAIKSTP
jgi:hypothetical protein